MKVAVIGTGYVGLVTGAGLADAGVDVCCVDVDAARIDALRTGKVPFYEPGLDDLVVRTVAAKRLHFTTNTAEAVAGRDVVLLCVGTPQAKDGSADISFIERAATDVISAISVDGRPAGAGLSADGRAASAVVIATKSTVPVGTAQRLRALIPEEKRARITIASNPEFLKEGDAVNDFLRPERIIIGADDDDTRAVLERLYRPLLLREPRIIAMSTASAELTKYAANGMLAVRITYMNELAALCEATGASVDDVRRGISADSRIGKAFLYAGAGYGGSCFPKDIKALTSTARARGVPLTILEATDAANTRQRGVMLEKMVRHFDGSLTDKVIAVWGLAFKPRTDDIREAPAIVLIEGLLAAGAKVRAWDRAAIANSRARFEKSKSIQFTEDEYAACDGADALVVMTEWPEFRMPDWSDVARRLRAKVVFDGRNIYDPAAVRQRGFTYYGIGRPFVSGR